MFYPNSSGCTHELSSALSERQKERREKGREGRGERERERERRVSCHMSRQMGSSHWTGGDDG
jgi:hypothetical protein